MNIFKVRIYGLTFEVPREIVWGGLRTAYFEIASDYWLLTRRRKKTKIQKTKYKNTKMQKIQEIQKIKKNTKNTKK